eukprot:355166-Chlamydomonas_euryale.AAC.4
MARVRTMENFSRYQQTSQPEIVTLRLMELVDKSKGYLKRMHAAEVAAPVAPPRVAVVARAPTRSADSKHTNSYGICQHTRGVANKLLWTEEL